MSKKDENASKPVGVPPPYPLAMVICDNIHLDPGTGKKFLLGCFSVIHARDFPVTHQMMCLYVSVTNGRGDIPFRVQLVDADEVRDPIWEVEANVESPDPRVVVELVFQLEGVTFPEPGEYRFQLFASSEFIMERRILVNLLERGKDDD